MANNSQAESIARSLAQGDKLIALLDSIRSGQTDLLEAIRNPDRSRKQCDIQSGDLISGWGTTTLIARVPVDQPIREIRGIVIGMPNIDLGIDCYNEGIKTLSLKVNPDLFVHTMTSIGTFDSGGQEMYPVNCLILIPLFVYCDTIKLILPSMTYFSRIPAITSRAT
jgi:hypothetical protein